MVGMYCLILYKEHKELNKQIFSSKQILKIKKIVNIGNILFKLLCFAASRFNLKKIIIVYVYEYYTMSRKLRNTRS